MSIKTVRTSIVTLLFLAGLILGALPAQAARSMSQLGQEGSPVPGDTSTGEAAGPSLQDTQETPETPQVTPTPSFRPILVLQGSTVDPNPVVPGSNFTLKLRIKNGGHVATDPMEGAFAFNIVVTFKPGTFLPLETGGVHAIPELDAGQDIDIVQTFNAPTSLYGQTSATQEVSVSYTDRAGTPYTESFMVGINLKGYSGGSLSATATPTQTMRPQLVISGYNTDVAVLQPGSEFTLKLEVRNLGSANARGVTMVMGGGSASSNPDGTPQPGGVDGSGGEFTNFAPLKSSNIQFVGDIVWGDAAQTEQPLIVNVSTNPGAYSVKFSFIYTDDKGARYTDAQVITLLVYSLPLIEIDFYQDPGMFVVGQPGPLPIQVTNLSRKPTLLGNLKVTVPEGAQVMNGTAMVGMLDSGGYFPMDAQLIPDRPGPMELTFVVTYTDDFNQPRTITQTKTIEVMEAPIFEPPVDENGIPIDPGMEGPIIEPPAPETFLQKAVRFLKGLVGLDSGVQQPEMVVGPGGEMPIEGPMIESGGKPVIIQEARPVKGP